MSENANTTMNGTQPLNCPSNPAAEKIGQTVAYCLIFLVSLVGNTVIGVIVCRTKAMRKPINILIVNMAMSNVLYAIFCIPVLVQLLYIDSWLIGGPLAQIIYKLGAFLIDVSSTVSIQSLVLIAMDRFGAVVYPLRSPLISAKLCSFFILATWIVAMAIQSPELVAFKLVEFPGRSMCSRQWKEAFGESSSFESYSASIIILVYLVPLTLITILYIIICTKLKSQMIHCKQSANAGQQRKRRERNVLKLSIAIVLGFAVCWLPLSICMVTVSFASDIWSCGFLYFFTAARFLARVNCAINPCICFIFSRNYREGFKTLFG